MGMPYMLIFILLRCNSIAWFILVIKKSAWRRLSRIYIFEENDSLFHYLQRTYVKRKFSEILHFIWNEIESWDSKDFSVELMLRLSNPKSNRSWQDAFWTCEFFSFQRISPFIDFAVFTNNSSRRFAILYFKLFENRANLNLTRFCISSILKRSQGFVYSARGARSK